MVDVAVLERAVRDGATASPPMNTSDDSRVLKFQIPEMVFGVGSLAEAGFCAGRLGARRPFVVTDPGIMAAGWVEELLVHLRGAGLRPQVWAGITPNPKDTEIHAGFDVYQDVGGDVIIGIGGGSAIDAAKAIAILSGNGGSILDYAGVDRIEHPIPPLLMIPTTAGTGADVSQFCIVSDTRHAVKKTIMGRQLVPDISVTDPRLLETMPADLAAATGLDALTHAVEAFVSRGHNPLSDGHALSAARLVARALVRSVENGEDLRARMWMAQASLEAGLAFSNAILGATHAMSHQVGGLLDVPHGVVNGVLLPHVIRFNAEVVPDRMAELADAMALPVAGMPDQEAAFLLAEHVETLADRIGTPNILRALGVREGDVSRLAATAMDDACLATNPRPASVDDIATLFRASL